MQIRDLQNRPAFLTRLQPNQTERTLGVYMSPQYNGKEQHKILTEKAVNWAATVKKGSLLPYDVFPLLLTTIMKSLEYPMALTHLSVDQWEKIMSPILRVCLPKAKICRTFPKAVIYGPQKYQGLGIPHPSGLQLTRQLDMLLRHPVNQTTTSRYLDSCLQSHQLETGTSYGLLQQEYSNTAILASDTWLKRVWKDLDSKGVHMELSSPALQLFRDKDALLMDLFIEAEVDQETLLWMNWCRMFLNVTTLSDIVTADGSCLVALVLEGVRPTWKRSTYTWPRTARPSPKRWDLWKDVLTSVVLRSTSSLLLRHPLGAWHDDIFDWKWLYSPSKRRLYFQEGHGWVKCDRFRHATRGRQRHRYPLFILPNFQRFTLRALPPDVLRTSVERQPLRPSELNVLGYPLE